MLKTLGYLLAGLILAGSVRAEPDLAGSADYPLLKRFPLSWIEGFEQRETPEYRLTLSELKKVNNALVADRQQALSGKLTRITYRIPEPHRPEDAFDFFRRQIVDQSGEILFQCSGRDCGSSDLWANDLFGIARLYGLDRTQHYLAARLGGDYLALYAVQRGNRRVYLQLDVVSPQGGGSLGQQLRVTRRAAIVLDERDPAEVADQLVQLFGEFDPAQPFWLVVHVAGTDLQRALDASRALADQLKKGVREAGFDRVEAFGVGPLVPSVLGPHRRVLVVVRPEE